MFQYEYEMMSMSVDCIIFNEGKILLIERGGEPYKGYYARISDYLI